MADLSQLGFRKGRIVECIVTTCYEDGSPNAAPMGVTAQDERTLLMKLHTDSSTYSNIIRARNCVINLVYDPLLFLKTALLKHEEKAREIKKSVKRFGKNAFALKEAHACIAASLHSHAERASQDEYGKKEFSLMKFKVKSVAIKKPYPPAPNRGLSAAIELAIELSRGRKENVKKYMRIMKKTLAEKEYEEIERFLKRVIAIKSGD